MSEYLFQGIGIAAIGIVFTAIIGTAVLAWLQERAERKQITWGPREH